MSSGRRVLPTQQQQKRNSIVVDENTPPPRASGSDGKLAADLLLRHRCARLSDVASVIKKTIGTLKEDPANQISGKSKRGIAELEKTVLPMMEKAVTEEMPRSIQKLSAIPATGYIHKTNETKEKRASNLLATGKKRHCPAMKRIDATLKQQKSIPVATHHVSMPVVTPPSLGPTTASIPTPDPAPIAPARVGRPTCPEKKGEERLPRMPLPENKVQYTAIECVTYLKMLDPKTRGKMVVRWVKHKLVPVNRAAVYRRLKDEAQGKPIKEFGVRGRDPMLSKKQINNVAEFLEARHGKGFTLADLKQAMKEARRQEILEEGNVPLQTSSPSKSSVTNYRAKVSEHPNISIADNVIPKTNSRITAENSLISAMSLAVAVAATHWRPTLERQWGVEQDMLMLQRLKSHTRLRVPNLATTKKGCAWVFEFQAKNTARLAALMTIQGHIKTDLSCLGDTKTLLANDRNFMTAFGDVGQKREGTYLYFDSNDGIHVRSGKVCGRPFSERHKEHSTKAREGDDKLFYSRYPSNVLTNTDQTRKGWFENLHQLNAVSFDSSSPTIDAGLSRIFIFDDETEERMSRVSFGSDGNRLPLSQKKRHMSSYLCELGYDLAICVTDNVSTSPGYESCGLWSQ